MDTTTRKPLIDKYKDGYRAVVRRARGRDRRGPRRTSGAGQVVRARDRASPRRQRDDVGDPSAAAHRERPAADPRLRPGGVRPAVVLRPSDRSVARRVQGGAADDGRDPRSDDGRGVGARGHAHRSTAATPSSAGSRSTRRTRTTTPSRSALRAGRPGRPRDLPGRSSKCFEGWADGHRTASSYIVVAVIE